MTGFAALDLETTGLAAGRDRIIEVSLVLYNQKGVEERVYSTLINPQCRIPPMATKVNGISDDMVARAPTFKQAAHTLRDALEGRTLVGHNINAFDNRFLKAEFAELEIHWTARDVLDTLSLARKAYPGLNTHKLSALCDLTGITNKHAHRAESDARATWQLLCTIAADDIDDLTGLAIYNLPVFTSAAPLDLVARKPRKVSADLEIPQTCVGEVVVFTGGKPDGFATRDAAKDEVSRRGGTVASSVSKKTTLVFAGNNAGATLDKARELGVTIAPHSAFSTFLENGRQALDSLEIKTILRFDGRTDQVGPQPQPATPSVSHLTSTAPLDTSSLHVSPSVASNLQPPAQPPSQLFKPPQPPAQRAPLDQLTTQHPTLASPTERYLPPTPHQTLASPTNRYLPPPWVSTTPSHVVTHSATTQTSPRLSHRLPHRSTRLAIILAILLGSLGVHRFYLGHQKSGLVMAAASLLSLGLLAPVMLVVGCIDAYRIATYRLTSATPSLI